MRVLSQLLPLLAIKRKMDPFIKHNICKLWSLILKFFFPQCRNLLLFLEMEMVQSIQWQKTVWVGYETLIGLIFHLSVVLEWVFIP